MVAANSKTVRRTSPARRLVFLCITLVFVAVTCELAVRAVWRLGYGLSFKAPDFYDLYYPETRAAQTMRITRDDDQIDVLLLGGSVLHKRYGSIAEALREKLTYETGKKVRIYNAANIAHTTRDSLLKYQKLHGKSFDLVLIYHGINETRANNCPIDIFRDDYSHYGWYALANRFATEGPHPFCATWATARLMWTRAMVSWYADQYVPQHMPHNTWLQYGSDIKSAAAFERNLRNIIDIARQRGDPIVLMTFATHQPADYARDAFENKQLDYTLHLCATELWGRPEHVAAAVAAHNDIIRRLATEYDLPLVDQQAMMPANGRVYNDICHLTHSGSQVFVDNLLPTTMAAMVSENGDDSEK